MPLLAGDEAERVFVFLGVMEPHDGVEAVEQAAELDDVLGLDAVVVEVAEQSLQPSDLVFDLGVGSGEGGGGCGSTQGAGDDRDQ